MARLTDEERDRLPDEAFAYIDKEGGRHLPIHDEDHARNALSRWSQTGYESKAAKERARKRIVAAAKQFGIEIDEDDKVNQSV